MSYRRITILILGILLIPALQGCVSTASNVAYGAAATDRRDSNTIIDDQYIEIKAVHALTNNHNIWKQSHINIVSYNNALLIVGQTPTVEFKREIEEDLKDIPKVRRLYNELSIGNPASLATRSKDTWITTQVKAKLVGSKSVSASHVKVITEQGIVYLMGITSPEEEMAATEIARAIPGVTKVVQIFERQS
jgi:osmotically-inducible protein OsmY